MRICFITVVMALLAMFSSACASDDDAASGAPRRPCYTLDGPDVPAGVCALKDSKELLSCKREPFTYSRQRDGLLLQIKCGAKGRLPERGGAFNRQVGPGADGISISPQTPYVTTVTKSLGEDWVIWPMAECVLQFDVSSIKTLGQQRADYTTVEVSIYVHDSTARVTFSDHATGDDFDFMPEECAYEALSPKAM